MHSIVDQWKYRFRELDSSRVQSSTREMINYLVREHLSTNSYMSVWPAKVRACEALSLIFGDIETTTQGGFSGLKGGNIGSTSTNVISVTPAGLKTYSSMSCPRRLPVILSMTRPDHSIAPYI